MILSARILNDVSNVNSFEYASQAEFTAGDAASIYFQLIDMSLDKPTQGFSPSGRRYIPSSGATVQVVADSIDNAKKITRFATNPFPDDRSIWKLDFLNSDTIAGSVTLQLTLNEGGTIRRGLMPLALRIHSQTGCI